MNFIINLNLKLNRIAVGFFGDKKKLRSSVHSFHVLVKITNLVLNVRFAFTKEQSEKTTSIIILINSYNFFYLIVILIDTFLFRIPFQLRTMKFHAIRVKKFQEMNRMK